MYEARAEGDNRRNSLWRFHECSRCRPDIILGYEHLSTADGELRRRGPMNHTLVNLYSFLLPLLLLFLFAFLLILRPESHPFSTRSPATSGHLRSSSPRRYSCLRVFPRVYSPLILFQSPPFSSSRLFAFPPLQPQYSVKPPRLRPGNTSALLTIHFEIAPINRAATMLGALELVSEIVHFRRKHSLGFLVAPLLSCCLRGSDGQRSRFIAREYKRGF